jgi:hypothetical protein
MITIELLEKIEALLPGRDDDSALRRRVVRILADAGGQLSLDALHTALGAGGRVALAMVASWDGLYWSTPRMVRLAPWVRHKLDLEEDRETPLSALDQRCISEILGSEPFPLTAPARLAGYDAEPCPHCGERKTVHSGRWHLCDACGICWQHPAAAHGIDPLAGVRAAVARARNVATAAEALAHAHPEIARFRTAS